MALCWSMLEISSDQIQAEMVTLVERKNEVEWSGLKWYGMECVERS